MPASGCTWQLAAWPWPGGQSALTSRIWLSSQAAAKWKVPSGFVETERYEPFYGSRLLASHDKRGSRTLACARNGKSRAGLQYRQEGEHSAGRQEAPRVKEGKITW